MLPRFDVKKLLVTGSLAGVSLPAMADLTLNMPRGVTPMSHDIYDLHMTIIGICTVIGIVVFGVMFYALYKHRKSRGAVAADFHGNTKLEIVWAIIPFLILIGMAIPATRVLMDMENADDSDVTIKIVGHQWKWQYQYLDQGLDFFSLLSTPMEQIQNKVKKNPWYLLEVDKPLVLPVNRKIRFLVTSNDVIHSWWVPDFGVKRDAIPGFMHESWARIEKPGVYRGQCAELCGINHGFMPIVVKAVPPEEFEQWVKTQKQQEVQQQAKQVEPGEQLQDLTKEELMKLGKEQYFKYCSACHQPDGKGISPMFPALKDSSVAVGRPISRHIRIILDGVPGTAMQAFGGQLSDKEAAAIVTYERNAWGNNTGDVVQPADVAEVRLKKNAAPITQKEKQTNASTGQAGGNE